MNIVTTALNLNEIPLKDKQIIYVVDTQEIYGDFYESSDKGVVRKPFGTGAFKHVIAQSSELIGEDAIPLKDKQIIYVADTAQMYADFYDSTEGTVVRKLYTADTSDLEERISVLEGAAARLAVI